MPLPERMRCTGCGRLILRRWRQGRDHLSRASVELVQHSDRYGVPCKGWGDADAAPEPEPTPKRRQP